MVRFGILAPNRKRPRIRLFEAPKHLGTGKLGPKRGEMLLDEGGGNFRQFVRVGEEIHVTLAELF